MISDQKVYKRNIEKPCKYIRQISSFNIILEIDLICKCNIYLCKYLPCFHRSKHVAAIFFFSEILFLVLCHTEKDEENTMDDRETLRGILLSLCILATIAALSKQV